MIPVKTKVKDVPLSEIYINGKNKNKSLHHRIPSVKKMQKKARNSVFREIEKALRDSEEKYRTLIENVNIGIYRSTCYSQGRFLHANPAMAKMFGYSSIEELMKIAVIDLYQKPEDRKKFIKEILKKGFVKNKELRLRKKNGMPIWASVTAKVYYDKNGTVKWIDGAIEDITERKKAEENLRESEEKLRSIFEDAGDGIVYIDTAGKILSANKRSEEILGYDIDEVIGKNFTELKAIDPSYIPIFLKIMKDAIVTGKKLKNLEIELIKKDGSKVYTEINASAVKKEGRIIGFSVIVRDIADRKKTEEQIVEYEEELSSIFEAAGDAIAYMDTSGNFITINKRAEEITGYKIEELIGKNFTEIDVIDQNQLPEILKILSDVINTGNIIKNFEMELIRKDGSRIPTEINTSIVKKEEKAIGIVVLIRDITDRKRAEETLKKSRDELAKAYNELKSLDRMKDDFVNISGHELKTPLVPIIAYIDLILKNKKSKRGKKEREELETCLRNAIRLKKLVTDILDISKLETKVMKFEMRPAKIENIINTVVQDLKPAAEKKHLELIASIKPKLPQINIDSERIGQALSKLVENSIKFTDKGNITISAEKQKNKILVKVSDTGIGIDKNDIPKLFTKFYQADPSPTRKAQGTGLGLFICKEIIEAHNGRILVESELGKGTTFSFALPFKKALLKKHHLEKAKKIIRSLYFEPK